MSFFSLQFLIKVLVSALVIASVSELGKKFTPAAAVLASLPLTSMLAFVWLYVDTHDADKIISLSRGVFWAVLPSLLFFLVFPALLRGRFNFWLALLLASIAMFLAYSAYLLVLKRYGITV